MFDTAFQIDFMSSEESSEEEADDGGSSDEERTVRTKILRIRYLAWRSTRLRKLYQILDEREELDRSLKPRRGSGRKDRRMGLPKEGNPPPPAGTARWMVSKGWLRDAQSSSAQVAHLLANVVQDDGDDTEELLLTLGAASGDEEAEAWRANEPVPLAAELFENAPFLLEMLK